MKRAALAAGIAAFTLFVRHAAQIIGEARREQRLQRLGRARTHAATLHAQCHCHTQTMVRIEP